MFFEGDIRLIDKPGDDTAWLNAVETPPLSEQLQAMDMMRTLPPCALGASWG